MQDREEEDRIYDESVAGARRQLNDVVLHTPIRQLRYGPRVSVPAGATVARAIKAIQQADVSCCLVTRPDGAVAGIFTERDVLRKVVGKRLDTAKTKIKAVMTADPECLTLDDSIGRAFNKMAVGGFRHVPLVDGKGKAIGVLSVRTLLGFLADHFPEAVVNLPPDSGWMQGRARDGG